MLVLGKYELNYNGGVEQVSRKWLQHLRQHEDIGKVCYIATKSSAEVEPLAAEGECLAPAQFHINTQPISFGYCVEYFRNVRDCDILHAHFPNIIAALLLLFAPAGKEVLIHWHADLLNKNKFFLLVGGSILRLACKRAKRIIVTSPQYAESSDIVRKFKSKIFIAPLTCRANETEEIIARRCDRYLLTVGRLVPYKGLEKLIEAMRLVEGDVKLKIVGKGPLRAQLEGLVHELGLRGKVELLGSVSASELNALYSECDAFVLNSNTRAEAFGVVLIEALSHAKPLLTSRLPGSGANYVNIEGVTGSYHDCDDPADIARNINALLQNSDLREVYSKNCTMRFSELFDDRCLPDYINAAVIPPEISRGFE
ncbi:glycosyltransferase [Litorivivens sp.]|uniref:glycosyltransferase n=1 Tax=Litorivivens sp. TaxID=2020868 RepID=UPI0035670FAA